MTTIAIDGTSALAQGGGIGRFTHGLLRGLAAVDRETEYVVGYAKDVGQAARPVLAPNFRWRSLGLTQKQATWLWHRLRLPLPADALLGWPALYHSPDYTLPPLARARGIVTIHDLSFEALPDVHHPSLRRYLQRAVPHSIARADHVFADSESTKQEIVRTYGTEPTKISVVYPGVEPRFRPFDPIAPDDAAALAEVRQRYSLTRPFLLIVGTLEPRKNIATLIRAFAAYRATGDPAVELVIAGGGGWLGEKERLQAIVQQAGLGEQVRFAGFVPDEQLPALINLARAMVYPSLYEGFGFPVLEALACGVPSITTRNTSLPEAGGKAALYIEDPRDVEALAGAMARVLGDDALRARMVAQGLAHARTFTWEATGRRVLELYRQVLETGDKKRA